MGLWIWYVESTLVTVLASSVHPPATVVDAKKMKYKEQGERKRRKKNAHVVRIGLSYLWPGFSRALSVSCLHTGWSFCPSDLKKRPGGGVPDRGRPSQRVKLWARSTGLPWQDKSRKPLHGAKQERRDCRTHEDHQRQGGRPGTREDSTTAE